MVAIRSFHACTAFPGDFMMPSLATLAAEFNDIVAELDRVDADGAAALAARIGVQPRNSLINTAPRRL